MKKEKKGQVMEVNVFNFDCYIDYLIVKLGPDLTASLSLLGNDEFDIHFESMLLKVFSRQSKLSKKDALLIASALLKDTSEFCYFMNLYSKRGFKSSSAELVSEI